MPTLDWMGKSKVVTHHKDVPYRMLVRVGEKGVAAEDGAAGGADVGNMIIHGDNLEVLKALLPEFEGRVDVVYIDPPYNTGNEGWVYNDNVNDPRIRRWLGQVVGREGVKAIFDSKLPSDTPKPTRLIERILRIAAGPDALVLDSFAGSGATSWFERPRSAGAPASWSR